MTLEQAFFLSQIIASIAVVASLVFVGHQVRENTLAIQRNEHNSTMEQWTVIRQAIVTTRDVADLMSVVPAFVSDVDAMLARHEAVPTTVAPAPAGGTLA